MGLSDCLPLKRLLVTNICGFDITLKSTRPRKQNFGQTGYATRRHHLALAVLLSTAKVVNNRCMFGIHKWLCILKTLFIAQQSGKGLLKSFIGAFGAITFLISFGSWPSSASFCSASDAFSLSFLPLPFFPFSSFFASFGFDSSTSTTIVAPAMTGEPKARAQ